MNSLLSLIFAVFIISTASAGKFFIKISFIYNFILNDALKHCHSVHLINHKYIVWLIHACLPSVLLFHTRHAGISLALVLIILISKGIIIVTHTKDSK